MIGFFDPVKSEPFHSVNKIDNTNLKSHKNKIDSKSSSSDKYKKHWVDMNKLYSELQIDSMAIPANAKSNLRNLIAKYSYCFSKNAHDLGKCSIYTADIRLQPNSTPKWVPTRPVPYKLQGVMDKEIENMEKSGMIKKCPFSLFNSAVCLVPKKGNRFRFVADMRSVNSVSMVDSFELPNLGSILDNITEFEYLSSFDFTSSFSQIPLDKNSRNITAFTYNGQRYEFARMVMGHKTSTAQFSRMMQKLFARVPFRNLLYFVDDLLLTSNTIEDHMVRLEYLLERLSYANLKLSTSKCKLFCNEVKFIGLKLSNKGIAIDEDRIKAIKDLKPPENVKGVHRILGLFGYTRKFIHNYAEISMPLYALLRKNTKFEWSRVCQNAFETLKNKIITSPVLGLANVNDPYDSYELTCDASSKGFGGILTQLVNGERRVIAYYSKSVPKHQRHWPATKLEFIGLHACLMNWKIYLQGAKKFKVFVDCKSLLNFDTIFSRSNAAMQRKLVQEGFE